MPWQRDIIAHPGKGKWVGPSIKTQRIKIVFLFSENMDDMRGIDFWVLLNQPTFDIGLMVRIVFSKLAAQFTRAILVSFQWVFNPDRLIGQAGLNPQTVDDFLLQWV